MTSVALLGGWNEIGGNKILIEDEGKRILLDFGPSFASGEDFFFDWLQPRSVSPLKDLLEFDMVPRMKGLYNAELLPGSGIRSTRPAINAIFISHAHYDHISYLSLVDPSIPVYMGETPKLIADALDEQGTLKLGEHPYSTFRTGQTIDIGPIQVSPIHVDHSIPGAYGYVVKTSRGTIAYTGDFRKHGPRSDMTRDFIRAASEAGTSILVIDGTRVAPGEHHSVNSEAGVKEKAVDVVDGCKELALATFYPRDLDRLRTFHEVAEETGRTFVISIKTAHLLSVMREDAGIDLPDPEMDSVRVYRRPKKGSYYKWERPFVEDAVDASWVSSHRDQVLMSLNIEHFAELIDIRPPGGSCFIRSRSGPFEENDISDAVLKNWLEHFGISFHQIHASGHCSMEEVFGVIDEIGPGKVLPVHTEHPEIFADKLRRERTLWIDELPHKV